MEWIIQNKNWIFSGIGVFILSLILGSIAKRAYRKTFIQKKTQKSGKNLIDHSVSIQSQSIVLRQGISYAEARTIAIDVYKDNFLRLRNDAAKLAIQRAEELTDSFLSELHRRKPEAISSMSDPGMQTTLFAAQKEYARTGDQDLEQLLVDLLVDRATQEQQSIERIVLDGSINVAPKLTVVHLDSLSVVLLLTRTKQESIQTPSKFKNYLQDTLLPFIDNLSGEMSCYEHLEYAGCGSIMRVARWPSVQEIFLVRFPSYFSGCSSGEARKDLLNLCPQLEKLFEIWSNSTIARFNLTTVGVSIAQANYRRRTRQKLKAVSPLIEPYVNGKMATR